MINTTNTPSVIDAQKRIESFAPVTAVAVIGGGIMGLTCAYRLAQRGIKVTLYERSDNPGGLASYIMVNGARIDRFYHTILSSDTSMHALIDETGLADKRHFVETKQGFYDNGQLFPFNTPRDLMRYPPLNIFQRFRLGLQVLYAQVESDWHKIDQIPVKTWLKRVSGQGVYDKVWAPLLRAKFDSAADDVPATYIWSRLRRMMGTRQGVTAKEMMCYLENGYYTLIEALAAKCEALGVDICLNSAVQAIEIKDGQAVGIRINDEIRPCQAVISTVPSPVLNALIPDGPADLRDLLGKQTYLGVICPLLILKESLMPYYVLNITDPSIPFTAVVETTRLIDPTYVKHQHLVYLPKYVVPDNAMNHWPDEQIKAEWLKHFTRMFPTFDQGLIIDFVVQRARYVEPIRPLGTLDQIPPIKTPVAGLFMGNTAMFYPDLGNGEAVTRFAQVVVDQVLSNRDTWSNSLSEITAPTVTL